jgi:large subunit ribosomal protein L32
VAFGAPGKKKQMPNPKRRHSKARRDRRRAHDHLAPHALAECSHCHEAKLPHQACPHCGYYRGREAVLVKEEA